MEVLPSSDATLEPFTMLMSNFITFALRTRCILRDRISIGPYHTSHDREDPRMPKEHEGVGWYCKRESAVNQLVIGEKINSLRKRMIVVETKV